MSSCVRVKVVRSLRCFRGVAAKRERITAWVAAGEDDNDDSNNILTTTTSSKKNGSCVFRI